MAGNTDLVPGPLNNSVLYDQPTHICTKIWGTDPPAEEVFKVHNYPSHFTEIYNNRVLNWVYRAGFGGLYSLGFKKIDHPLITALVERWRPETNTFHFPVGELTVTLQDIEVLGGVRVDGEPVIRSEAEDNDAIKKGFVGVLLGEVGPGTLNKDWVIRFEWLATHFDPNTLPDDATEDRVIRVARACILRLIGSMYLQDSQGTGISYYFLPFLADLNTCGEYSWGSAILAYLYRNLCQAALLKSSGTRVVGVKGPLLLLQCWAWSRFTMIAPTDPIPAEQVYFPRHPYGRRLAKCNLKYDKGGLGHSLRVYRDQFDQMSMDQVIWEPYPHVDVLPECSKGGRAIWCACVPLICLYIVEYHNVYRVMRQFGMRQGVPRDALRLEILRDLARRGRSGSNWPNRNAPYVARWNARLDHVEHGEHHNGHQKITGEYMAWYQQITRRWIGSTVINPPSRGIHPTAGRMEVAMRYIERSYKRAVQTGDNTNKEDCLQVFGMLGMEIPEVDEGETQPHTTSPPMATPEMSHYNPEMPGSSNYYYPQMPDSSNYYGSPNIDLNQSSFDYGADFFNTPNWGAS